MKRFLLPKCILLIFILLFKLPEKKMGSAIFFSGINSGFPSLILYFNFPYFCPLSSAICPLSSVIGTARSPNHRPMFDLFEDSETFQFLSVRISKSIS